MKTIIEFLLCGVIVCIATNLLHGVFHRHETARESDVGSVLYAQIATPVFNTPDVRAVFGGKDGNTLKVDNQGLIRAVETVLLPGQSLRVRGETTINGIKMYRVTSAAYPYPAKDGLYVDARFVGRQKPYCDLSMPANDKIISNMLSMVGSEYIWGGNYHDGIMQMLQFYPPQNPLDGVQSSRWTLAGVDCSGLLYEATNGNTPRNTSSLITFGRPVGIAGLSAKDIAARLKPLDLIVWKGHVLIAIDSGNIIESTMAPGPGGETGVRVTDAVTRLSQIMHTRTPADSFSHAGQFVIRRWYGVDDK
ncbi:MAG TPA: peptidoglycan endopeptidase [Phycisphaerae bacterium]|nr:peptidoglycan endopeptidase [Phycisphaerae bacterium]HPS53563.1 peptidoglycan endopeptidase [Phycisphaerae bacterium]